jgi:RNA polymerase sigma-70 factor (sigma-E family)
VDAGFEEWARARTPALLRRAYLLTGQQQSAEDLVQSTLERVATAWRRIDDADAYARQVMYRLQVSWWRRRRVRERLTDSPIDHGRADETAVVDIRLALADALRRLTSAQRCVLVLRFYEDLSEAETATALECSVGNVKSQTHKALAALRRAAPELAELVGRRLPADA